MTKSQDWKIFQKDPSSQGDINRLPPAPSWRTFSQTGETEEEKRGKTFQIDDAELELINAAIYLRRPLLVEGKPGTGKTTIAYAIAHQLQLGKVLRWDISTRSTIKDSLYDYDAIARLRDSKNGENEPDIGQYITLGALGTALYNPSTTPRVLLIDEIDKSDIDLPNDLLNLLEEGRFKIPELVRYKQKQNPVTVSTADEGTAEITDGIISCSTYPIVILTSNREREFPPPFLRRCIRLEMKEPDHQRLQQIVRSHFLQDSRILEKAEKIIERFLHKRDNEKDLLATDQLLNAIYLVVHRQFANTEDKDKFIDNILQKLAK